MRKAIITTMAVVAMLATGMQRSATAGFVGTPLSLRGAIQRIKFDSPTLPPLAFTAFCLKYQSECKPHRVIYRGGKLQLTAERLAELRSVNREVNSSIRPQANADGIAGEKWLLHPAAGDCNDYAVTKRHDLIEKGWPAHTVLLSEVVTGWGEHHLVVVVRTSDGDLVLDNLTENILPWSKRAYRWVRIQTPNNPNYWASLGDRNA